MPQVGIRRLERPTLGAVSGPIMGLNDPQTDTGKRFPTRNEEDSTDNGTINGKIEVLFLSILYGTIP